MAICNNVEWQLLAYREDINRFFNPSIEIDTTGFTASGGALAKSSTQAYVGAYSLSSTGSGATYGWRSTQVLSTTIAATYTFQAWLYGVNGVNYRLVVYDAYPANINATADFTGTGDWQQVTLTFTAGATSETYEIRTTAATTGVFYTDAIEVRSNPLDTYIDGDQIDCAWDGIAHNSSSRNIAGRRGSGQIIDIEATYSFKIGNEGGAGMLGPDYKELDRPNRAGTQSTGIKVPRRIWQLGGIFDSGDWETMRKNRNELSDALGNYSAPFVSAAPQMIYLRYIGEEKTLQIGARYDGGLDNTITANSLHTNRAALRFLSNEIPYWQAIPQDGQPTDPQDAPTLFGVARRVDGQWTQSDCGNITGNTTVYAVAVATNGNVFVGGDFTSLDGVANTAYCASYNPLTATWSPLETGLNGIVYAVQALPDGRVAVGGAFTNAGGDANSDYLAIYDPTTDTFGQPTGNPLDSTVYGLALDPSTGDLIVVGAFTQDAVPTTLNRVARLNLTGSSAFSAVGSVSPGLDGTAYAVGVRSNGQIIVGGAHTEKISAIEPGGTAFYEVGINGGANNNGRAVYVDLENDMVYVGGSFTTFDGETANRILKIGMLSSTYVQWETLGSGFDDGSVRAIAKRHNGEIRVGGTFTTCGDLTSTNTNFIWTGSRWVHSHLLLDVSSTNEVYGIAVAPNGDEYIVGENATSQIAGQTTIDLPDGAAATYPVFEFARDGRLAGEWYLISIENYTTGARLDFNSMILLPSETVRVDIPNQRLTSSMGRALDAYIINGSLEDFYLKAGENIIMILSEDDTVDTIYTRAYWYTNYESVDAAEDDD